MAKDARWPMLPFIIVRAVQLFFGIVILGMTAFICSDYAFWWAGMGVFISLVVMLWMVANFILFFLGLLLPLAVVIVDAFCLIFVLITMAGTGASGYLESDCAAYGSLDFYSFYSYTSSTCKVAKAAFALELLLMFMFIGTLVVASLTLHKTRKDLRGKKYNAGLPFVSGDSEQAQPGMQESVPQQAQYQQPQYQQPQYQQPQQPAQAYTQQPTNELPGQQYQQGATYDGFVSPPTSPPPMQHSYTGGQVSSVNSGSMVPQHSGQYSTASSGAPLQQQPPYPVNEMQGTVPQPKNELPS